jgi:hypothetical protein
MHNAERGSDCQGARIPSSQRELRVQAPKALTLAGETRR